jgi:excisionase family DNA binding protein
MNDSEWLTRAETAKLLEVSPATVDRYVRLGRLTRYRTALNRPRFRAEQVRELLGVKPEQDKDEEQ